MNTPRSPAIELDPRAYARGLACVHCGLCLPACPTYVETGNEADSPRGRIQLMLGLADGRIDLTPAVKQHLDLCLDCRGCETACPSGVVYHELIEETRQEFARKSPRQTFTRSALRWFLLNVVTRPTALKLLLVPARLMQWIGMDRLLPAQLGKVLRMIPLGPLWPRRLPDQIASQDPSPTGFFTGCVGSAMFGELNRKSARLLSACRATVRIPRQQVCCGAIHLHNGDRGKAMELARRNIDAFDGVKLLVTNVAGCGAMLREYDVLLRDDQAYADRARAFAGKVRDISEALLELGLPPMTHRINQTVTYHDACHLVHAQRVAAAPRILLSKIPGLRIVALPESDMCCGAAGSYNLQQPEMAASLARRKLENITSTGASVCVAGNIGCEMHITAQARSRGIGLSVVHPVELAYASAFGRE